jgi:hypothetical protein
MPLAERRKDKSQRFMLLPEGSENLPVQSIFAGRHLSQAGCIEPQIVSAMCSRQAKGG